MLWKNRVFSRRRLRTLACIDFGVPLASFGRAWASKLRAWASKLGPSWSMLGMKLRSLASCGLSWAPWTDFELHQEYFVDQWRRKITPWRPPGSILQASSHAFGASGKARGLVFWTCSALVQIQSQFNIIGYTPLDSAGLHAGSL